jgi:hypothetical protein
VAVGSAGNAYFSNDPEEGHSWAKVHLDHDGAVFGDNDYGDNLTSVSCPTISTCVTADADGNVLSTADIGQKHPWKSVELFGKHQYGFPVVTCVSVSLCAVADTSEVFTSHDPTGSASLWKGTTPAAGNFDPSGIGCTASNFCLLAYSNDEVVDGSIT